MGDQALLLLRGVIKINLDGIIFLLLISAFLGLKLANFFSRFLIFFQVANYYIGLKSSKSELGSRVISKGKGSF